MTKKPGRRAHKKNPAVRFLGLRRKTDALTIDFANGSEWLTIGVVVADSKRALLSIDCTHAPSVNLLREAVATTDEDERCPCCKSVSHTTAN